VTEASPLPLPEARPRLAAVAPQPSRGMRICMVVPYDLADEGGVKHHAFHLADALRRRGDEVEIVGPLRHGEAGPHVRGFGGVVNVPANGAANFVALLTPPWQVRHFFRSRQFDVVHLHEPMVPMLTYYAAWFSRAALVATFHMYAESENAASRAARGLLSRLLFPSVQAAIAVSPAAAEYAAPFWPRSLPVIPNGVPTGLYHPGSNGTRPPGDALRLLFVGSWRDERKGLPVLLEACARLRNEGVNATLDVVGQGGPGADRRSLPGVTFHGVVAPETALAEHYRSCDVFVSPATGRESFGIVLLEAMASGRALVCSDIRGYRDLVDVDGALLVPPGDPAALARALAALAGTPARRLAMGIHNRTRAEAYDWDHIASEVRAVYRQAIRERRRP
jgi:phosphatidyl-myo-inositol alpha-mannosyltransferase